MLSTTPACFLMSNVCENVTAALRRMHTRMHLERLKLEIFEDPFEDQNPAAVTAADRLSPTTPATTPATRGKLVPKLRAQLGAQHMHHLLKAEGTNLLGTLQVLRPGPWPPAMAHGTTLSTTASHPDPTSRS